MKRAVVTQTIRTVRLWLARSKTRATCGDAYSDLLLAATAFGKIRDSRAPAVEKLEGELLARSHDLRAACHARLRRR